MDVWHCCTDKGCTNVEYAGYAPMNVYVGENLVPVRARDRVANLFSEPKHAATCYICRETGRDGSMWSYVNIRAESVTRFICYGC